MLPVHAAYFQTMSMLPYGRQEIDDDDVAAVVAVLRGNCLTTGPAVGAFEAGLCAAVDAPFATVCSSGTAALHLATATLDLKPDDVCIVPAVTFAATANAVRYCGAEVVFADVDPSTGLMHTSHLEEALERCRDRRVRAVFPVHLAGQCAELPMLAKHARAAGAVIIEDASHAIGTTYTRDGARARVGACADSDITIFSFHPVKTIAMGEGGAVTTRDPALWDRISRLRAHGIVRDPARFSRPSLARDADGSVNPWYYELQELGFNYRASDIQCALGLSQLAKLTRFVDRRAALVARYRKLLAPLEPVVRPISTVPGVEAGWHLQVVLIDFAAAGLTRARVMRELAARGVGTQVHYIPLHMQPYYRDRYGEQSLAGAERYYAQALSLPLYPSLSDEEQDGVIVALKNVLAV